MLTRSQLDKKFPALYGNQRSITASHLTHNAKQAQYMERQQDIMFLVSVSP